MRLPLAGLVSIGAALAAGHLVAGLVGPPASPLVAVANSAVDRTPHPVKDFAIRTFGIYDKFVLLVGMLVVLVLMAVAVGLVSRRRWVPGGFVIGGLGVVGVLAVLDRPDVGVLAVLAPVVSLIVGVVSFRWLHGLALADERRAGWTIPAAGSTATPAQPTNSPAQPANSNAEAANTRAQAADTAAQAADTAGGVAGGRVGRRGFVWGVGVVGVGALVGGGGGVALGVRGDVEGSRRGVGALVAVNREAAVPVGADFVGDGTPSFVTANRDFYRVDTAVVVPRVRAEDWSLRVHGMVGRELVIGYDDLRGRPLTEKTITLTCVSNEVGGPYVSTARFIGVPVRDVLAEAGIDPRADQVVSRSDDGWTAGTPTAALLDREALLALGMNGEPLPVEHGFPVRMVVPGLYGYVSATKWLVELELTTFEAFDAYWVRRGWAEQAPIKTMSRIDRPRDGGRTDGPGVVIAGVAWAQHTGIEAVEVSVDDGPWREATLATEVSVDTWRMWRFEAELTPGEHTAAVRATDRAGRTQTGRPADPVPDGATGWHTVTFDVS